MVLGCVCVPESKDKDYIYNNYYKLQYHTIQIRRKDSVWNM